MGTNVAGHPSCEFPLYTTHQCLVRKHLTPEVFANNASRVTPAGVTFADVIAPSLATTARVMGLRAGDEDTYEVFKDLFDPVIDDQYHGFRPDERHPPPEQDASQLVGGRLAEAVTSCRVRTRRSVRGFCLPHALSRDGRVQVSNIVVGALDKLGGEFQGSYYPLSSVSEEERQALADNHLMCPLPDCSTDELAEWKEGRGVWVTADRTLAVWVNYEDHCRVVSVRPGGDLAAAFDTLCRGLQALETALRSQRKTWMYSQRLGFLGADPADLGTGLRASVHARLPHLKQHPKFNDILTSLGLEQRSCLQNDLVDISNKGRLKKSERAFVQQVIDGVNKLIELEQQLNQNKAIENMIN